SGVSLDGSCTAGPVVAGPVVAGPVVAGTVFLSLEDLDHAAVAVDPHEVTGPDHGGRVLVQAGHRGHVRDHDRQGDLGVHDVEDHGLRPAALQAGHVQHAGPPGRALRGGEHEDLPGDR